MCTVQEFQDRMDSHWDAPSSPLDIKHHDFIVEEMRIPDTDYYFHAEGVVAFKWLEHDDDVDILQLDVNQLAICVPNDDTMRDVVIADVEPALMQKIEDCIIASIDYYDICFFS